MLLRFIAAKWAVAEGLKPDAFEGKYGQEDIEYFQSLGYNTYFFPNYPSDAAYDSIPINPRTNVKRAVKGKDMDTFEWVFADMDLKQGVWKDKDSFIDEVLHSDLPPTRIVDSGNGVHVYWKVTDLDPMSFLRLNRRICRRFKTDVAVSTLNQLMRAPGTLNVKEKGNYKTADLLWEELEIVYDCEMLDKLLPSITLEDEAYCKNHYDKAHGLINNAIKISNTLPAMFQELCRTNTEVKDLFYNEHKDRSAADFRLGHLLFNAGMSKEDAMTVLFNTSKATERTSEHRYNYACNIVDKAWVEADKPQAKPATTFPIRSAKDVMNSAGESQTGKRFYCHPMIDATEGGFKLGHVMGMVGGFGNGKTTTGLNLFAWFAQYNVNQDYVHLYVTLEQPEEEIIEKWALMSKHLKQARSDIDWDSVVHVLDNYNEDGTFRSLGMDDIRNHVFDIEKSLGKKVGCVVVDHIGILRQEKKSKSNEMGGLIGVCEQLKAFAVSTQTFLVIQSQTSRSKNGGGDMELDMDAAFGTSSFESYSDFIFTTWQPLRRILDRAPHMTIQAFRMPKIRKRHALKDKIKPESVYAMYFDPNTELMAPLTDDQYKAYEFWNRQATSLRNKDRKKEPSTLRVIDWLTPKVPNGNS